MGVLIDNHQARPTIAVERIQLKAQAILSALGRRDAELSVVIVDDDEMAELNERYLGHQGPTNVIAFPMQEGDFAHINPSLLGDVVISAQTAEKEGQAANLEFLERFDQLLIHGILHLCGYDHEKSAEEEERMEAKSRDLWEIIRDDEKEG